MYLSSTKGWDREPPRAQCIGVLPSLSAGETQASLWKYNIRLMSTKKSRFNRNFTFKETNNLLWSRRILTIS